MKKVIRFILYFFFAVLFMVGCSVNNGTSSDENTVVNTYGNTAGNLNNGGTVAQQGDWIYYSHFPNRGLYKVKTDGSGKMEFNNHRVLNLNVLGDWIYYINMTDLDGSSYKVRTDGKKKTRLHINLSLGTVVIGDWAYTGVAEVAGLYKMKIDGTEKIILDDENLVIYSLNVVGDWIYYSSSPMENDEIGSKSYLYKIRTDGTERIKLNDGPIGLINVVDDWIYYIKIGKGKDTMHKIKTDGTGETPIVDDENISTINVVDNWIFYSTIPPEYLEISKMSTDGTLPPGDGEIFKIKTDGTEKTKLTDDIAFTLNIADGWIYYSNYKGILIKIKTDGTKKMEVN